MPRVFYDDQEFQAFFEATDSSDAAPGAAQLTEEESLLVASRFHQILAPFMLRRLKDQVMAGLAPKVQPRSLLAVAPVPVSCSHRRCYSLNASNVVRHRPGRVHTGCCMMAAVPLQSVLPHTDARTVLLHSTMIPITW